jgi:hypothetical protein
MTTTTKTRTKKPQATTKSTKTPAEKIQLTPSSRVDEIFSAVSSERLKTKKIEILQNYNENFIKSVLIWNFDDSITSDLPPGEVPITSKEDADKTHSTNIRKEWSKFYNFVKGGNDAMSSLRKETMFINILDSLHPKEAEILVLVKDKNLADKYNITKEIVSEAYPDIQWGGRS